MPLQRAWHLLVLCATLWAPTVGQPSNDDLNNAAWVTSTIRFLNGTNTTLTGGAYPGFTQNRGNDFELLSFAASGSNVGATMQPDEPAHGTHGETGKSVWWKWRSPINGTIQLTTLGSDFDTAAAVYVRVPWDGISVTDEFGVRRLGQGDDVEWNRVFHTELFFPVLEGETYWVAVGGFQGAQGAVRLAGSVQDYVPLPLKVWEFGLQSPFAVRAPPPHVVLTRFGVEVDATRDIHDKFVMVQLRRYAARPAASARAHLAPPHVPRRRPAPVFHPRRCMQRDARRQDRLHARWKLPRRAADDEPGVQRDWLRAVRRHAPTAHLAAHTRSGARALTSPARRLYTAPFPLRPFTIRAVAHAPNLWRSTAFVSPAYRLQAAAPQIVPWGGTYDLSVTVVASGISDADGRYTQEVRYTRDGTAPTEASPLYTTPLLLTPADSGTVVRARAWAAGMEPSNETRTPPFVVRAQLGAPTLAVDGPREPSDFTQSPREPGEGDLFLEQASVEVTAPPPQPVAPTPPLPQGPRVPLLLSSSCPQDRGAPPRAGMLLGSWSVSLIVVTERVLVSSGRGHHGAVRDRPARVSRLVEAVPGAAPVRAGDTPGARARGRARVHRQRGGVHEPHGARGRGPGAVRARGDLLHPPSGAVAFLHLSGPPLRLSAPDVADGRPTACVSEGVRVGAPRCVSGSDA
jgi:hypothetical protein